MPYSIVHQKDKWFVKNHDSGKLTPQAGYKTKAEAQKYLGALESHVADAQAKPAQRDAVKRQPCEFIPVRSMSRPEEIEGYLALWGSPEQKDCLGTYFDKNNPPMMDLDFLPKPLRYGHGQDREVGKEPIGKIDRIWLDERGIPFHAVLDTSHHAYPRIANEIARGILATSSGTTDYLAEFADDGRFVSWPVSELSLTDRPCEFRMPAVAAVRSMPDHRLQLEVKPVPALQTVTEGDPRDCGCDDRPGVAGKPQRQEHSNDKDKDMNKKRTYRAGDGAKQPEGEAEQPKRGLTLGLLGLDANATLDDVWQKLCDLVGDKAANAIMEDLAGPQVEAEETDDESMLAEPDDNLRAEGDPESDSRPESFMGDTDTEDLTEGKSGTPARNAKRTSEADLTATLRKLLGAQAQQTKPRSQPKYDELAELRAQNKLMKQMLLNAPTADKPTPRGDRRDSAGQQPRQPRIEARDLLYDMHSAADLAYGIKVLQAAGKRPSDSFYRAAAYKIANEIEKGTQLGSDMTIRYLTPFRSVSDVMRADIKAFRANEVMGDGNSGFGSNYIGVFYDTSLWLKVRAMPIWRELEARGMEEKVIPVGYASDVIPLEGADFTWYRVPETVDVDATGRPKINITPGKAGTSSTTLAVKTLGALVYYSVLLEEDSIVPMAAELNRKAAIEVQEQIEYVVFNGDTATGTGNLNLKNGTVNASDVFNYTVADGILKAAIIGNSGANARAAAALSDLDYQLLFSKLGNNGITGSDPTKLMFVTDPSTGLATDRLPIVKTKDINTAATVERGHATEMYGVPIFRSGQIALADSTGYIDSVTPANNKFGRIALVRPDQWVIGFKRQVTLEYFRDVPGQSNGMVITLRLGLQNRAADQCAAATYNVTVS